MQHRAVEFSRGGERQAKLGERQIVLFLGAIDIRPVVVGCEAQGRIITIYFQCLAIISQNLRIVSGVRIDLSDILEDNRLAARNFRGLIDAESALVVFSAATALPPIDSIAPCERSRSPCSLLLRAWRSARPSASSITEWLRPGRWCPAAPRLRARARWLGQFGLRGFGKPPGHGDSHCGPAQAPAGDRPSSLPWSSRCWPQTRPGWPVCPARRWPAQKPGLRQSVPVLPAMPGHADQCKGRTDEVHPTALTRNG